MATRKFTTTRRNPHTPVMPVRFFQFARRNCCNYYASGPTKIPNYCCLSPKETGGVCLLAEGKPCQWFADAVVPLDKDLLAQWQKLPATFHTCQQCGVRFKSLSQNQPLCPACVKGPPTMVPAYTTPDGGPFIKCSCGKDFEITRSGQRLCPDCIALKSKAVSPAMAPKANRSTLQCACGKAFTPTSNRQTRCTECAKEKEREATKARVRKCRANRVAL
jgi:hypothetical protein